MSKLIFVSCILTTWFVLAHCARNIDHVQVDLAPAHAPSLPPSEGSAPPTMDCLDVIYAMADCVPYLSDGPSNTKPDASCCSGFEMVLKTSADCICEAIQSSSELGLTLNLSKAMALPKACGLSAPPLSKCGVSMSPDSTPANPPSSKPKPHVNVVPSPPAPAPAPTSGTHPISASLALILSMLAASFYCLSF